MWTGQAPRRAAMPPALNLLDQPALRARSQDVAQPGFRAGSILRLIAAPPALPAPQRPPLAGTAAFGVHRLGPAVAAWDVPCYFATDATISGSGQVWLNGALLTTPELMPAYVHDAVLKLPAGTPALHAAAALPVRVIDEPCVVLPGGHAVYGHFLIETMFDILLVRRLMQGSGVAYKFLLPDHAASWQLDIMRTHFGIADSVIATFRPASERVHLAQAILPGMIHRADGFHPFGEILLDAFLRNLPPAPPHAPRQRLFLVRGDFHNRRHIAGRACMNEAALAAIAQARHGFAPVRMETLPWREQISLAAQAHILLGQAGSALHTALFSPPGTRIASLGVINNAQSHIAALRGHDMAFLTRGVTPTGDYEIDESLFADFLDALCAKIR